MKKKVINGVVSMAMAAVLCMPVVLPSNANVPVLSNISVVQELDADAASYSVGTYEVNDSSGVNVRKGAGTSYSKLGAAKNGTQFEVTKVSGDWGYGSIKCTNGTQKGWVCLKYTKSVSTSKYKTGTYKVNDSSGVNVRKGAGTSYSKLGAAKNGTQFEVTKVNGDWGYGSIKCTNGTQKGWVCLKYTKCISPDNPTPSDSGKVSLNVPYYSQGDSRWKNVALGNTTMGKSGCIVTSIAMAYSYRQNKTFYPNTVKNKLSFTNTGAIYWSSVSKCGMKSYSKGGAAISQSIMREIYTQLKAGKPVVMWCTNKKGNAHAVCITGYNGSTSSFSASKFTIKDPGYSSRTNLQQHLNYVDKVQYLIY